MNSDDSLKIWLKEIKSEILFWDRLLKSKGKDGGDPRIFEFRTNPDCQFQLPHDLESLSSKILDVGSGPYSRLGYVLKGKRLDLTLIDPLSYVYKKLEQKWGLNFAVSSKTGFVECLNLIIPENFYDLVHMSNSLDHCFDPIEGIKQLLFVTKVGGKVILRHNNNVAESENYSGLHQWNLTTENGNFIVWNHQNSYVVNELLKDYASIEYAAPCEEETLGLSLKHQKVIIRKKSNFPLSSVYAGDVLVQLCEYIMQLNIQQIESGYDY